MKLKDRSGDCGGDRTEERFFHDILLALSVCDKQNLLCAEDAQSPAQIF